MKTYQRRIKTTTTTTREKKLDQINHIPANSLPQQRRSSAGSKPRTDFSLFFCSYQGLLPESPSSKEELSTITVASQDETNDRNGNLLDLPLAQWNESQIERKGTSSNSVKNPTVEASPVGPCQPLSTRNGDEQRCGTVRTLDFTPDKSQITVSNDECPTPGSVVWAKKACNLWWPAEVSAVGSPLPLLDSNTEGSDGLVLVQYYGNQESAWINPARDLSPFEDCFEERSCNPMEEFQEALKQAIDRNQHLTSCKQFYASPRGRGCLNAKDQSPDTMNSSNSSRTNSDYLETGRSKRKRKPRLHFDEVNFPANSAKKVRRLKIMRFLGLAAPAGSPFLQSLM